MCDAPKLDGDTEDDIIRFVEGGLMRAYDALKARYEKETGGEPEGTEHPSPWYPQTITRPDGRDTYIKTARMRAARAVTRTARIMGGQDTVTLPIGDRGLEVIGKSGRAVMVTLSNTSGYRLPNTIVTVLPG